MASIYERHDSRGGERSKEKESGLRTYTIELTSSEDEADAWQIFAGNAPAEHDGYPLKNLRLDPQGAGIFYGEARYEDSDKNNAEQPKESGDTSFEIDFTSGSEKRAVSLQTVNSYVAVPNVAPDFKRGINVTKTGVEGVDIPVGECKIKVKRLVASSLAGGYSGQIEVLQNKVNLADATMIVGMGAAATAFVFFAGELRFDGGRGAPKGRDLWEFNLQFSVSRNVADKTIGDITGIDKDGWDYLWVYFAEKKDVGSGEIVRVAHAVYVERVFDRASMTALGIFG